MFFFRKPNITIDAFTYMGAAYELFKVEPANKSMPDWWKKIPPTFAVENQFGLTLNKATMKSCIGLTELYKQGITIPLWSELVIETSADGSIKYQWALDQSSDIVSHSAVQMGNNFDDMIHLKLQSPWLFNEKSGVNFVWSEPSWNLLPTKSNIRVLPGVTNYKYQADTNINIFIPRTNNRIELEAGLPLVHLVPISDKNIEIVHHLIDKSEFIKMSNRIGSFKFRNSFRTMLKIKEDEPSKCPFGFK